MQTLTGRRHSGFTGCHSSTAFLHCVICAILHVKNSKATYIQNKNRIFFLLLTELVCQLNPTVLCMIQIKTLDILCTSRMFVPWASYQIYKIAGCACAGDAGNVFPRRRFQRKPLVSDPGMHHGTCVTHVPWCMPGSLTCGDGENVPGIPGACAPAILCIW